MGSSYQPRAASGFTLVELLVAMSLMSLILLAMSSAMHTMGQTESRLDERSTRLDDFRSTLSFLRSTLGRVSMRLRPAAGSSDQSNYLFEGGSESISWIGAMPARYGAGGRHFFRLTAEPWGQGYALVLRYFPWTPGVGFPDWTQVEGRVLVGGVTAFAIQYEDARTAPGEWLPDWSMVMTNTNQDRRSRLPSRVRLQIQVAAIDWPELVISTRLPASQVGGNGSGFTIGGGEE
jgi:general secretion pathway protein J